MKKNNHFIPYILFLGIISATCTKHKFLEAKPDSGLVVPTSLTDFQQLLDNTYPFSISQTGTPEFTTMSSDEYYTTSSRFSSWNPVLRNVHRWEKEIYEGQTTDLNWSGPFNQILVANIVLEGLDGSKTTQKELDQVYSLKGQAFFRRAYALYNLAQLFCSVYDDNTAESAQGLPLRLSADVNRVSKRSTVQQTYDQILKDLEEAVACLPISIDMANPNRATKPASFGMLSRVYLSMGKYEQAKKFADSCLKLHSSLLNYSDYNTSASSPFPITTSELIYFSNLTTSNFIPSLLTDITVDSVLYLTYTANDLRKGLFFNLNTSGKPYPKNAYARTYQFTGIATDEIYLIRAECLARAGKVAEAMTDLNDLLRTRWKKNPDGTTTYVDQMASTKEEALEIILLERRKELCFRGLRWTDLRRLNKEGANITLRRLIEGKEYTLPPKDPRWILPIPPDEITLSGIEQNRR